MQPPWLTYRSIIRMRGGQQGGIRCLSCCRESKTRSRNYTIRTEEFRAGSCGLWIVRMSEHVTLTNFAIAVR